MSFQNQHCARVNERDLQKDKELYMEFSTTLQLQQKASLSNAKNLREHFYMAIKDDIKNTRLELIEKKLLNRTNPREFNLLKPVSGVQKEFAYNDELSVSTNVT